MNCAIELLIVEDSESDGMLLLRELQREGYAPIARRVDRAEEFQEALTDRIWDAVVCDYRLPQFSAPEALRLFREHGQDVPFIVVSGSVGEEKAVSMMKAGADDFILKSDLARFVPALEREMAAARDRRAHKRAEGAMRYLAAIVDSSEDAIYGKDVDSIVASWNPAAERLFGYSAEEMIGRSTVELFPLSRRDELLDILASIRRGDMVRIADTERVRKGGEVIPVSITISPIRNLAGEVIGASSIVRDMRGEKQGERERRQLNRRLMDAALEVKALSGMLPICAACKRVRDDQGYWEQVESYISRRSEVVFSHSLCPECAAVYAQELEKG